MMCVEKNGVTATLILISVMAGAFFVAGLTSLAEAMTTYGRLYPSLRPRSLRGTEGGVKGKGSVFCCEYGERAQIMNQTECRRALLRNIISEQNPTKHRDKIIQISNQSSQLTKQRAIYLSI